MRTLAVSGTRLVGRRTAVGRHIEHLARYWSEHRIPFDRVVIFTPGATSIDGLGSTTEVVIEARPAKAPLLAWEQVVLPVAARKMSVLLCEYAAPFLMPTAPIVVANHGIYEALPTTFSRWRRFRATSVNRPSARRAAAVIANSANTAADLVRFFGLDPDSIDVVYPAAADVFFADHDPAAARRACEELVGPGPFVLFVGKLSARRNVPNLVEAMAAVRSAGSEHRLCIVGPDLEGVEPVRRAAEAGIADAVVHHEHMEQHELALLYAGADLFVLPSLYEGISWTVLEAMASGTPVLAVDHPTMGEAAGTAAFTVPDPSVPTLAAAMTGILEDGALRSRLSAEGRRQSEPFSMSASAAATTAVLDRVGRGSDRG